MTNTNDYLRDRTGNRRFLPIDVGRHPPSKSVWRDLEQERDQLWAEAVARYKAGEPLYLEGASAETAVRQQEYHREVSAREGLILDFLERPVPQDWACWSLDRRRVFWGGNIAENLELVPRERICALEIWCELFEGQKKDMRYSDTQEINSILAAAPGWQRKATAVRFGYCGTQRGFVRDATQGGVTLRKSGKIEFERCVKRGQRVAPGVACNVTQETSATEGIQQCNIYTNRIY